MAWDIPDNNPDEADRLILKAIHAVLNELENEV